jgi:hypothetical protein
MILGGMSLSEEPISSQAGEQVSVNISTFGDLPIDTAPYYAVEAKSLCWTIHGDSVLDWTLENCEEEWTFVEGTSEWISDNTCN